MTRRQCATAASGVSGMCGSAMPALQAMGMMFGVGASRGQPASQPACQGRATLGTRQHNVALPIGKQSNSCRALQAIGLYMQRSAHLLTSTWISGAPKCLLTSRGTNPTCVRAGRGGGETHAALLQAVWSHHKQRQAGTVRRRAGQQPTTPAPPR